MLVLFDTKHNVLHRIDAKYYCMFINDYKGETNENNMVVICTAFTGYCRNLIPENYAYKSTIRDNIQTYIIS